MKTLEAVRNKTIVNTGGSDETPQPFVLIDTFNVSCGGGKRLVEALAIGRFDHGRTHQNRHRFNAAQPAAPDSNASSRRISS
jgi:hypothetical protein